MYFFKENAFQVWIGKILKQIVFCFPSPSLGKFMFEKV